MTVGKDRKRQVLFGQTSVAATAETEVMSFDS